MLLQGQSIASGFGDMVARLNRAQRDADTGIRGAVDQVNALVTQISGLNASIASAGGSGADVQTLKDRQQEAVKTLSGLLNIDVLSRQDGGVDITFGLGRPLVIGDSEFALTATATGPLGLVTLTDANGVSVGGEIDVGHARRAPPGARHDDSRIHLAARRPGVHAGRAGEHDSPGRVRPGRRRPACRSSRRWPAPPARLRRCR